MNVPSQPATEENVIINRGTYEFVCRELEATHRHLDDVGIPTSEDTGTSLSISQRVAALCKAYQKDRDTIVVVRR